MPLSHPYILYFIIYFILVGFELKALTLEPLHQPFFMLSVFEIDSCVLFAQAGLKLPLF
jgi:hypothetical protein